LQKVLDGMGHGNYSSFRLSDLLAGAA